MEEDDLQIYLTGIVPSKKSKPNPANELDEQAENLKEKEQIRMNIHNSIKKCLTECGLRVSEYDSSRIEILPLPTGSENQKNWKEKFVGGFCLQLAGTAYHAQLNHMTSKHIRPNEVKNTIYKYVTGHLLNVRLKLHKNQFNHLNIYVESW